MSRADTTAMLSQLGEKRLRNQCAFWASEVNGEPLSVLRAGIRQVRVRTLRGLRCSSGLGQHGGR